MFIPVLYRKKGIPRSRLFESLRNLTKNDAWLIPYTPRSNSLGFDPWAGPTTPLCSISSTRRAARL